LTFVLRSHLKSKDYHFECGWGNGYVALPPGHLLWGINYDQLNNYIRVHGGLTYSNQFSEEWRNRIKELGNVPEEVTEEWWVIGFDTAHFRDNEYDQDEAYVRAEAKYLKEQIDGITMGTINAPPSLEE